MVRRFISEGKINIFQKKYNTDNQVNDWMIKDLDEPIPDDVGDGGGGHESSLPHDQLRNPVPGSHLRSGRDI